MVSVSGFRGRVGEALTPELVTSVSAAFGAFVGRPAGGDAARGPPPTVVVGRDSRTSGPHLLRAVTAGLESVGCRVVDVGLAPTPTLLLAVTHHGAHGGIAVTASHNPVEWNALKLASSGGLFLDAEESARFREYLSGGTLARASWDALGARVEDAGAIRRHIDAILDLPAVAPDAIRSRGFVVGLDCVHGAGGALLPDLLTELGCEVVGTGLELDGRFPRDPEPTAGNLDGLGELVRRAGADVGFAVDPDVDRLSLVDDAGEPLGEDLTLALAAAVVLRRRSGTVVTNLSTSRVVEDVAAAHGSPVVRAPVGEIHVARRMEAEGAVVGGEGNGGVIVPDLHLTRDAPAAVALILQHLVDEETTLDEAAARWPSYAIVKEKLAFREERLDAAYRELEAGLPDGEADRSDGLRLAWPDRRSWVHVRPSGTEPVVRVIAEAPGADEARELVSRARGIVERAAGAGTAPGEG